MVIIISTVLPGTLDREILPQLCSNVKLCYNPFFIAMGTTMRDFYHPEFILFGVSAARSSAPPLYLFWVPCIYFRLLLAVARLYNGACLRLLSAGGFFSR